jgi:hypothetical protein
VLSRVPRKTFVILIMLLVCATVALVIACQFHPAASAHQHEFPPGHHHGPAAGGVACLTAVLPASTFLVLLTFSWFWVAPLVLPSNPFGASLFKPPKTVL